MSQIIYTNCDVIQIGCYLYSDSGLFVTAPAGIYSDGYYVYYVYGTNGRVADIGLCQLVCILATEANDPITAENNNEIRIEQQCPTTTTTTTASPNFIATEANDELQAENNDLIITEQ